MSRKDDGTKRSDDHVFDYDDDVGLYGYIGAEPKIVTVRINIVGEKDDRRILVVDAAARARRKLDHVHWIRGANCGDWKVRFDKGDPSPLDPAGPYQRKRTTGGFVDADVGEYRYTVEAYDLKTRSWLTLDPDVVVVPMY